MNLQINFDIGIHTVDLVTGRLIESWSVGVLANGLYSDTLFTATDCLLYQQTWTKWQGGNQMLIAISLSLGSKRETAVMRGGKVNERMCSEGIDP